MFIYMCMHSCIYANQKSFTLRNVTSRKSVYYNCKIGAWALKVFINSFPVFWTKNIILCTAKAFKICANLLNKRRFPCEVVSLKSGFLYNWWIWSHMYIKERCVNRWVNLHRNSTILRVPLKAEWLCAGLKKADMTGCLSCIGYLKYIRYISPSSMETDCHLGDLAINQFAP